MSKEGGSHPTDFAQHDAGVLIILVDGPRMVANQAAFDPLGIETNQKLF